MSGSLRLSNTELLRDISTHSHHPLAEPVANSVYQTMSFSVQDRSISDRTHEVKRRIFDLLQGLEAISQDDQHLVALEDILYRFKLWAGNLGALHHPEKKISLDNRLLNAPQIAVQICKHLDDLNETINECEIPYTIIFQPLLTPWYSDSSKAGSRR